MIPAHDPILRAAAAGDDHALAELVRAYHDRVYRFGARVCRDGDADDAVQEAFLSLARRPSIAADPGALSWLFTVVKRACLRLARVFVRERTRLGARVEDVDEVAGSTLDPERALERWRLVDAVHRALSSLEPTYREVVVLRDLEGLDGPSVAAALGLSEAAMKSRLHRGRQSVRAFLEREISATERGPHHVR